MSRHLPSHPNLEYLKNQAKDLLSHLQQQDHGAKLADALHAIAREYGFLNWASLKAHVEAVTREETPAPPSVFVGRWLADVSRSAPEPANPFQSAMLTFEIDGDIVRISDVVIDASGQTHLGQNRMQADGREHPSAHGYVLLTRWLGSRVIETLVKKDGRFVSRLTYEVSDDGRTLTLAAAGITHDGYPGAEQMTVFTRGASR
jgi:hypothetical protein